MYTIHEFRQPIEVDTPSGRGRAIWVTDYGPEAETVLSVILHDSRKMVHVSTHECTFTANYTFGRGEWTKLNTVLSPVKDTPAQPGKKYIGLFDEDGDEAYEGAIVMRGGKAYEVYWDNQFQWSLRNFLTKEFDGSLTSSEYIVPDERKWKIVNG